MPPAKKKNAKSAATDGAEQAFECPPNMDISSAEGLQQKFEEILAGDSAVRLQAAGVESADTACLQLICVLRKELQSRSLELAWEQPSDALLAAARMLGLTEALGLQA